MSRVRRPSKYSEEFRADAVALVLSTEIGITQAARDLGVSPETLRNWVKQAKIDRGLGSVGAIDPDCEVITATAVTAGNTGDTHSASDLLAPDTPVTGVPSPCVWLCTPIASHNGRTPSLSNVARLRPTSRPAASTATCTCHPADRA